MALPLELRHDDLVDVEKAVLLEADVDERCLHARKDVVDDALVDVPGDRAPTGALEVHLDRAAVLEDGDALLAYVDRDEHLLLDLGKRRALHGLRPATRTRRLRLLSRASRRPSTSRRLRQRRPSASSVPCRRESPDGGVLALRQPRLPRPLPAARADIRFPGRLPLRAPAPLPSAPCGETTCARSPPRAPPVTAMKSSLCCSILVTVAPSVRCLCRDPARPIRARYSRMPFQA